MKSLLLPIMTFALVALPAAADAAQCRNADTGKFAKCGAPGSVPASQYVAKTKSTKTRARTKAMVPAMAGPAAVPAAAPATMAPAKPGLMAMMKARMKPAATATPAAKPMRCKNAKSKFVKCGTAGAKPA